MAEKDTVGLTSLEKSLERDTCFVNPIVTLLKKTKLSPDDQEKFICFLHEAVTQADESFLDEGEQLNKFVQEKDTTGILSVISTTVPHAIVGNGFDCVLKDVKVKSRGPDDRIYAQNPDIQKNIPRGTTLLCTKVLDNTQTSLGDIEPVIYANRKFTGGIGDEDEIQPDTNDEWKKTFLRSPDEADLIVFTEKVNGEAAHFSGRYIGDDFFIFTGSKNVHMMIRDEKDIDHYTGQCDCGERTDHVPKTEGQRFQTASVVAREVCRTLSEMVPANRKLLQHFLNSTRATLVCELLQKGYQHIVNLDDLPRDTIKVISLCTLHANLTSLLVLPVHFILEFVKALGLRTAEYEVFHRPTDAFLKQQVSKVRGSYNTEGSVLYYMHGPRHNTIGMYKLKSVWYIMLRAVREKAVWGMSRLKKEPQRFTMDDLEMSIKKRLGEIKKWLNLSDAFVAKWIELGEGLILWLRAKEDWDTIIIRPAFPALWREYLATLPQQEQAAKPLDDIDTD